MGPSYTPSALPSQPIVSCRLIFQLERPPSPVRVDIQPTELPFRNIFSTFSGSETRGFGHTTHEISFAQQRMRVLGRMGSSRRFHLYGCKESFNSMLQTRNSASPRFPRSEVAAARTRHKRNRQGASCRVAQSKMMSPASSRRMCSLQLVR